MSKLEKKVLKRCPCNLTGTIPANMITTQLDVIAQESMEGKDILQILNKGLYKDFFWASLYVAKWGWDQTEVLDFYTGQIKMSYKPYKDVGEQ